jgi:hypothetical protein
MRPWRLGAATATPTFMRPDPTDTTNPAWVVIRSLFAGIVALSLDSRL